MVSQHCIHASWDHLISRYGDWSLARFSISYALATHRMPSGRSRRETADRRLKRVIRLTGSGRITRASRTTPRRSGCLPGRPRRRAAPAAVEEVAKKTLPRSTAPSEYVAGEFTASFSYNATSGTYAYFPVVTPRIHAWIRGVTTGAGACAGVGLWVGFRVSDECCIVCAPGRYAPSAGAVSPSACLPCPAGTYVSDAGNDALSDCIDCGVGKYLDSVGNRDIAACIDCVAGTYIDVTG
eukprot:COSAG04_NODE_962_length_9154_cov_68.379680_6_plen_239_part_00